MQSSNYDFRNLQTNSTYDVDLLPPEAMSFKWHGNYMYLEELIPGYQTLQVTGRELMGYKVNEENPPGMDGTLLESAYLPARDIEIKYLLKTDDPNDFRQKYNKLMHFLSNQALSFNFRDEPDYYYSGILTDADTPDGGKLEVVSSFTLHCPSPWKFSEVKTLTVGNGGKIEDNYLIYPVIPESITFKLIGADFRFTNQTQNQTFGLMIAHNDVVLTPQKGEVSASGNLILNDIMIGSQLEKLTIKSGDVIQITNGSEAVIKYRRWLL
ncbi:hypothetical protein DS832_04845 [Bombilactobacillus bombi]|uniref:Siphovirus-type tail component RIFT-related domain-containing protein n=1 Tax=Bombilactobacillus bombi TaxID=1303590 RepID=A0A3R6YJ65_9LACO|nr:distal tail protein Dit [Bombilactobacillus bombi]RHW46819.1 hypothetical protein DS832_04845 [Bombilactobacillus bombi]